MSNGPPPLEPRGSSEDAPEEKKRTVRHPATGEEIVVDPKLDYHAVRNRLENPYLEEMKRNLGPERIAEYQQTGRVLYEDMKMLDQIVGEVDPVQEAYAQLKETIKSGLHPSFLTENEKRIMAECGGREWFLDYGYTVSDLLEAPFPIEPPSRNESRVPLPPKRRKRRGKRGKK